MTDREGTKNQRWSKRAVRATAWTAVATAFISALGALGVASKPATAGQMAAAAPRKVIVRRIVRKVVIVTQAKPAPVQISSSGQSTYAPAAPAPVSTGGSQP